MYKIYIHINKVNNKKYVGQTKQDCCHRWWNGEGYKPQKNGMSHFYNAIKKYGWDNFEHKILKNNLTKQEADYWEKFYIKQWDLTNSNKGYNKTDGGQDGKPNLETRNKMRKKHPNISGGKNPKARKIICIDTNEFFECIKLASEKYHIPESDIRQVCKQLRHTAGGLRFCYAENFNQNMRNQPIIRQTNAKKIICIETQEIFNSALEAQQKLTIDNSSILKNCKGYLKSAGKLHFKFYKEDM